MAPAARQNARGRKPPRILLCSVCTVACVLFMGSAAMLAVGYLNPFGTVGLSILGVGAVAYFGTILFLALSCLTMQRKYPGMQPLSFRVPTRRPGRPPPTTVGNPNISGQIPSVPITSYRVHNDLPPSATGFKGVPEKPPTVAATSNLAEKDKQRPNKENQVGPDSSHDFSSVISESLKDPQDQQGLALANKTEETVPPAQTDSQCATDQGNVSAKTNVTSDRESHTETDVQQQTLEADPVLDKKTPQTKSLTETHANQEKVKASPSSSPKRDSKGNKKTHHVEVPFDDYPSSASSVSSSSKKHDISTGPQESKEKYALTSVTQTKVCERKREISNPTAKTSDTLAPADTHGKDKHAAEDRAAPSASPSATAKNVESKQAENQCDKSRSSHTTDYPIATKVSPKKEQQTLPIHQEKEKSHARKSQSPQRDGIHQESPQTTPHSKPFNTSSPSPNPTRKHVPSGQTFLASPPNANKTTLQLKHEKAMPETSKSKETAAKPNPSPVNPRKPLNNQQSHAYQDQGSSPRNERKVGPLQRDKRTEMPHKSSHMQPSTESSSSSTGSRMPASPPKHGMQHRKDNVSAHVSSPVGRNDVLHHKHYQTDNSQLARGAFSPSGISNTSPKKSNQGHIHNDDSHIVHYLPDPSIPAASLNAGKPVSPVRTQRGKQEQRVTHSQEFLSTGSPPSPRKAAEPSPPRPRQRSPNVSPKRDIRTDELNKRHGNKYQQQTPSSSHSSDAPTSSPLNARKLLQYEKDKAHTAISSGRSGHSSDSDSSSARGLNMKHETQLHVDKSQRSPRFKETTPAAAETSPPCIKKSPTPHEKDQV